MNTIAVIILAAGKGSRMKSDLAKVLHRVAGKSMVNHVIEAARDVAANHIHVVVGHQADAVQKEIQKEHHVQFAFQKELLGTGDAVKTALPQVAEGVEHVMVLCGDVPLIKKQTIADLVSAHQEHMSDLTVLAAKVADPTGYGRIIKDTQEQLLAIREEADATEAEKQIDIVNSGIFCFKKRFLESGLGQIQNNNSQGEYYLTDLVEVAVQNGARTLVKIIDDPEQVMGVNTVEQLTRINTALQKASNELS
ncbi:MAG: nucleoside-diphosphate-sugar pyrophosphorylase [Desulfobacter postgatei]|uniref:Nucleoside-diphosphate-sugar pyrophosphorylase n=1 Tax=Desulfobacter postgatei TaxID=2293 RepID=A0A2G6MQ39_9BACT|nr:MAG: nucleoside-diphosphate-sugar pyrophosphorylase [Desulfobacter postgatei]